MNQSSIFVRSFSFSLTVIFFINSSGYANHSFRLDDVTNCREWELEISNPDDNRIEIEPNPNAITDQCGEKFTLHNNTDFRIGGIGIGGGYTLKLSAVANNGTIDFLPYGDQYLIPGLSIEVLTTPVANGNSSIILQGNITPDSIFLIDLPLFALSLIPLPTGCIIPSEKAVLMANRVGPIFGTAASLFVAGEIPEAKRALSSVLADFYQGAGDSLHDLGVDCAVEALEKVIGKPVIIAKLTVEMTLWLVKMLYDSGKYDGPASITLSYSPPPVSVFPTQEWIAFLNKNNIWFVRPDGTELTQVTFNNNDNPRVLDFKWSPSGKMLAYELGSPSGNIIFLYDIQTSESRTLLVGVEEGFDWSVTNKQLLFKDKGIWIYNLETTNKRKVLPAAQDSVFGNAQNPRFSPDSNYVLLSEYTFDAVQYYVANIETGIPSLILPADHMNGTCEWAPTDPIIACTTAEPNENAPGSTPEILLLDVNGEVQRVIRLPEKMAQPMAYWTPSGKELAVAYYNNQQSFTDILDLESGDISPLTTGIPLGWSANQQWLLTWDAATLFTLPRHLAVVDTNTGETRLIMEFDGLKASWQPILNP